jgi:hypothetical protein
MEERKDYMATVEEAPTQYYFMAALGSIAISGLLFLIGRRNLAFFVGLWPPTILALALFSKMLHPSHENVGEQISRTAKRFTE